MLKGSAIFAGALLLGVGATAFGRWTPNSSSDWAAWVQAFGTIAAIGASAWLLHYQAGLQRRSRLRAIQAVVELAVQSVTQRLEVPEGFEQFDLFASLDLQKVRFAFDALCKIPLHEVDSADAVRQVSAAIEAMRKIAGMLASDEIVGAFHRAERVVIASAFAEETAALRAACQALDAAR
ncbi:MULTISPECIES: hypothetical protein [Burkholderia]|uniref:hypothetical protein n=1 Tax=Burkholderia TaxID=32008 RepID=UPI0010488909|nr:MULTISPECIES: hypothetical protein [Burkholderia]TCW63412.1 hypothetical protein C5O79_34975 [Burkholderia sp. SRS-25]